MPTTVTQTGALLAPAQMRTMTAPAPYAVSPGTQDRTNFLRSIAANNVAQNQSLADAQTQGTAENQAYKEYNKATPAQESIYRPAYNGPMQPGLGSISITKNDGTKVSEVSDNTAGITRQNFHNDFASTPAGQQKAPLTLKSRMQLGMSVETPPAPAVDPKVQVAEINGKARVDAANVAANKPPAPAKPPVPPRPVDPSVTALHNAQTGLVQQQTANAVAATQPGGKDYKDPNAPPKGPAVKPDRAALDEYGVAHDLWKQQKTAYLERTQADPKQTAVKDPGLPPQYPNAAPAAKAPTTPPAGNGPTADPAHSGARPMNAPATQPATGPAPATPPAAPQPATQPATATQPTTQPAPATPKQAPLLDPSAPNGRLNDYGVNLNGNNRSPATSGGGVVVSREGGSYLQDAKGNLTRVPDAKAPVGATHQAWNPEYRMWQYLMPDGQIVDEQGRKLVMQ